MKIFITVFITVFITGCLYGKNKELTLDTNYVKSVDIKTIKRGKKQTETVYLVNKKEALNSTDTISYAYPNGKEFTSKSNIMIKFLNPKKIDIDSFESQYGLKLIRKMRNGSFLFRNLDGDSLEKINEIVDENQDILKKISPDYKLKMQPM